MVTVRVRVSSRLSYNVYGVLYTPTWSGVRQHVTMPELFRRLKRVPRVPHSSREVPRRGPDIRHNGSGRQKNSNWPYAEYVPAPGGPCDADISILYIFMPDRMVHQYFCQKISSSHFSIKTACTWSFNDTSHFFTLLATQ